MPAPDDTVTQELARTLGRVLPPVCQAVGLPAWALRFGVPLATVGGVVLFVVGKRLVAEGIEHLGPVIVDALKRIDVKPAPVVDEGGAQQGGTTLPSAGEPGGGAGAGGQGG